MVRMQEREAGSGTMKSFVFSRVNMKSERRPMCHHVTVGLLADA